MSPMKLWSPKWSFSTGQGGCGNGSGQGGYAPSHGHGAFVGGHPTGGHHNRSQSAYMMGSGLSMDHNVDYTATAMTAPPSPRYMDINGRGGLAAPAPGRGTVHDDLLSEGGGIMPDMGGGGGSYHRRHFTEDGSMVGRRGSEDGDGTRRYRSPQPSKFFAEDLPDPHDMAHDQHDGSMGGVEVSRAMDHADLRADLGPGVNSPKSIFSTLVESTDYNHRPALPQGGGHLTVPDPSNHGHFRHSSGSSGGGYIGSRKDSMGSNDGMGIGGGGGGHHILPSGMGGGGGSGGGAGEGGGASLSLQKHAGHSCLALAMENQMSLSSTPPPRGGVGEDQHLHQVGHPVER
ncbi:unnamed protein product [Discosporangium mesarthrocarpum]